MAKSPVKDFECKSISAFVKEVKTLKNSLKEADANFKVFVGRNVLQNSETNFDEELKFLLSDEKLVIPINEQKLYRINVIPGIRFMHREVKKKVKNKKIDKKDIWSLMDNMPQEHILSIEHKIQTGVLKQHYETLINSEGDQIRDYAIDVDTYGVIKNELEDIVISDPDNNLSRRNNQNLGRCPGINSAMEYLASANSYSTMNREDASAESICLVKQYLFDKNSKRVTKKIPAKIWIIIHNANDLSEKVKKDILKNQEVFFNFQKKIDKLNNFKPTPNCCDVLDHKDTFFTCSYLERKKIEYSLIYQYPGDIIFLSSNVYHQIFNLVPNRAVGINYGSAKWQLVSDEMTYCWCPRNQLKRLALNDNLLISVKTKKVGNYECSICDFKCKTFPRLGKHLNRDHKSDLKLLDDPKSSQQLKKKDPMKYEALKDSKEKVQEFKREYNDYKVLCKACNKEYAHTYYTQHSKSKKHQAAVEKQKTLLRRNNLFQGLQLKPVEVDTTPDSKEEVGFERPGEKRSKRLCKYCDEFVNVLHYKIHTNTCSAKKYQCNYCNAKFNALSNKFKHIKYSCKVKKSTTLVSNKNK